MCNASLPHCRSAISWSNRPHGPSKVAQPFPNWATRVYCRAVLSWAVWCVARSRSGSHSWSVWASRSPSKSRVCHARSPQSLAILSGRSWPLGLCFGPKGLHLRALIARHVAWGERNGLRIDRLGPLSLSFRPIAAWPTLCTRYWEPAFCSIAPLIGQLIGLSLLNFTWASRYH